MTYFLAALGFATIVRANPVLIARQGVTQDIAPSAPAPPGCSPTIAGSFGIAVHNISKSAPAKREVVSQITDGQIEIQTLAPISMISDGQIQAGLHTVLVMPIANQQPNGEVQKHYPLAPVTEYVDGQPQAPIVPPTPASSVAIVSPLSILPLSIAPPSLSITLGATESSSLPVSSTSHASAPTSSGSIDQMIGCEGGFSIKLEDQRLTDQDGRTGYIASNYQFQFDKPPQADAIYTSGFSVCSNGSLTLGGSSVFYQCRSGNFYNLYDRSWAAQCSPVTIDTLKLVPC